MQIFLPVSPPLKNDKLEGGWDSPPTYLYKPLPVPIPSGQTNVWSVVLSPFVKSPILRMTRISAVFLLPCFLYAICMDLRFNIMALFSDFL